MKILFSVPFAQTFSVFGSELDGHEVQCVERGSDWGLKGIRKRLLHLWEGVRTAWLARRYEVLVLCTIGIEAFVVAAFRKALCPNTRLVVVDFLIPRRNQFECLFKGRLSGVHAFVCIRSGDIRTLEARFGVSPPRCSFAPFPAREIPTNPHLQTDNEEGFIYSAGFAHRDWDTLISALREIPFKAVLSPGFSFRCPSNLPTHIEIIPPQSPEDGRRWLAKCTLAVFSLVDTELPSGPLVLLDAMMMAKPIVVSEVNGTRDYVQNMESALVVPTGDPQALAKAILEILDDPEASSRMGRLAACKAKAEYTNTRFMQEILKACRPQFEEAGRENCIS